MKTTLSRFTTVLVLVALVTLTACGTTQAPNRQVNDLKITAEVKSKLASEVRASSLANVVVNTTNGIVTLAGQVENESVKRKAEEVARNVPGVMRVNNNLQVEGLAQQQTSASSRER